MSKRAMSWVVLAAMTFGGAGYALGGAVMGARADNREPVTSTLPIVACAVPAAPVVTPVLTPPTPVTHAPSIAPSRLELSVRRMQVTSGIEQREPIDHPSAFDDTDERIYAFLDLSNPTNEVRHVLVTFENGQRVTGLVTLDVPAHNARFRTWAWTRLSREPGEWTAIVRDEAGNVLATDAFEIR